MEKQPRHRPQRSFVDAKRVIVECKMNECIHCDSVLVSRKPWHMSKTVQTMNGHVFVAGRSKECANPDCSHSGMHYYASGVLSISLPYSTYGMDVLAFIGWQHEHENRQLIEIHQELKQRGVIINERNVGKLYRQFLALLGGMSEKTQQRLEATEKEHGGLIWAIDALQPEGHGTLLYVLYEVLILQRKVAQKGQKCESPQFGLPVRDISGMIPFLIVLDPANRSHCVKDRVGQDAPQQKASLLDG